MRLIFQLIKLPFFEIAEFDQSLRYVFNKLANGFVLYIMNKHKRMKLMDRLLNVKDIDEWHEVTNMLDKLTESKTNWKDEAWSEIYDYKKVYAKTQLYRRLRANHDVRGLISFLRKDLIKNNLGISDVRLYKVAHNGTKKNIETYHNEIIKSIQYVYYYRGSKVSTDTKLKFFELAGWGYGRTALMLSGGAGLGKYHYGIIKALNELDLMPRILCGSSAGSIVSAFICTHKFEELNRLTDFDIVFGKACMSWHCDTFYEMFQMMMQNQSIASTDQLKNFIRDTCRDLTFREVYEMNGWILNITVTDRQVQSQQLLLNYITAPDVLIWSASICSCAIPDVYAEQELYMKTPRGEIVEYMPEELQTNNCFIDGSIGCDIPTRRIGELFNVTSFIVS